MTEIHKDSGNTDISSFQEEIILENYFAGANRAEVLSQMKEAVQGGVALMVLTGDEGSGKTMMCHMLEHEVPASCICVFFPHTVDSFEDVVTSVASQLGLGASGPEEGRNIEAILQQIAEFLQSVSKDLLVIFDEAENIYLATLERNRKMLDLINGRGARMHILFSGRKTLLENCSQLSICDFKNTDELHLELTPLSETETGQYLKTCSDRLVDGGGKEIFDDEKIQNIYEIAKGNFRMTTFLAEESMSGDGDETSFRMLLESVKGEAGTSEENGEKLRLRDILRRYTNFLPWVGGILCCLLLLVFLFRSGDEQSDDSRTKQQPEKSRKVTSVSVERTQKPAQGALQKGQTRKTSKTGGRIAEEPAREGKTIEKEPPAPVQPVKAVVEPPAVQDEMPTPESIKEPPAQVKTDRETEKSPVEVKVVENVQPAKQKVVVELSPTGLLKRKPARPPEVQKRTIKLQSPRTEIQDTVVSKGYFNAEQLLRERFSAAASWKSGGKDDMYTVQLMVLASKVAEKNLLNMLVQKNYRQEAGNFFVFKKATPPENIFVFYGEYPNIAMARLAQDSFPRFLRDHKPYVISIKGAITKVQ